MKILHIEKYSRKSIKFNRSTDFEWLKLLGVLLLILHSVSFFVSLDFSYVRPLVAFLSMVDTFKLILIFHLFKLTESNSMHFCIYTRFF